MAKKEKGELKKRALLAKQRLKMGYWQKLQEERREFEAVSQDSAKINEFAVLQKMEYVRVNNFALNKDRASKEESLYNKVCEILKNDENTTNPIGQLVEHELYDDMDSANKQRYILELSQKFRELRERYYRETRNCVDV